MSHTNLINVDGSAGTALLIVRNASTVELTRFTFSNAAGGSVTFAARPLEATLSREVFERNAVELVQWRSLIETTFNPPIIQGVNHDEIYLGRPNTLRHIFRLNGKEFTNTQYFRITDLFVLKPRAERFFKWTEFVIWQRARLSFLARSSLAF